jgi:hypothetical protein
VSASLRGIDGAAGDERTCKGIAAYIPYAADLFMNGCGYKPKK